MSHDLAELLEAAAPEPQRLLNPEELLRAARRRVTVRRRAGGALGAAVLAGVETATLLIPTWGHQSTGAVGGTETPAVSALETTSPLPASVTRSLEQSPYIGTGRGTLVRQLGGEQIYLAPVNNGELICIVDLATTGPAMTCAPRSALLSTGVYLASQLNEASPAQAMIVVPDGYTTARSGTTTATVAANLAVLQPVTDGTVTLSGPHRPSITIHWGPFGFPPAPAKTSPSLVAPPTERGPTTCGQSALYAQTTTEYVYLLSCSSGTLLQPPTVTVPAGSIVKIAGPFAAQAQISLPPGQVIARLDSDTITALVAGQVVVTTRGIDCATNSASQPTSCPLLTINIR